jgi:hypothetical protein
MWALTLTAASIHLTWMNAPELLVGGTFVGLGSRPVTDMGVDPCWRRRRRDLPVCRDSAVHCLKVS